MNRHLADSVDLVLRGHLHETEVQPWTDPDGRRLLSLAAGCLYETSDGPNYPNSFNVIDLRTSATQVVSGTVEIWAWSKNGFWHRDSSVSKAARDGVLELPTVAETTPALVEAPTIIDWTELRTVIERLAEATQELEDPTVAYDFSSIDAITKDELNNLGEGFALNMTQRYEPYFTRLEEFLERGHPDLQSLYYRVVQDVRDYLAAKHDPATTPLEDVLLHIAAKAVQRFPQLRTQRAQIRILLAYMYRSCSVGRKSS